MGAYSRILLPWDSQPQEFAGAETDGIGASLVSIWTPLSGSFYDAKLGTLATILAAPSFVPTHFGRLGSGITADAEGSTSRRVTMPLAGRNIQRPCSITLLIKANTTANTVVFEANGNNGFSVQTSGNAAGNLIQCAVNRPGAQARRLFSSSAVSTANDWRLVTFSWALADADCKVFVNGVDDTGTLPSSFSQPDYGAATTWDLFSRAGSFGFTGAVAFVALHSSAISADEARQLYNSLWASAFAPRSIWVPVSAGGATTHDTTGALTGAGSVVAGTAAHIAKHATSGALTGPGASIAGASARTRAHPTSGALTGPGSVVDGTAAHVVPGGTHDTSGALTGPGSSVVGSAAHIAKHATSGVLVGPGAVVDGTAARVAAAVSHDTSGALVGPGAVVGGQARGPATEGLGARGKRARRGRFQDFDVPLPAEVVTSTIPSDKVVEPIAAPKVEPVPAKASKLAKPKPKKPDAPAPEVKAKARAPTPKKPAAQVQAPEPPKAVAAPRPMMLSDILSAETMTPEEMIAAVKLLARIQLGPQLIRSTPKAKLIRA